MKIIEALDYQSLYKTLKDQQIPIKLAYKLNKLYSKTTDEVKFYEDSIRKILDQYAEKDPDGNFIQNESSNGILIQKSYIEICQKKITELQLLEFNISDISFTFEELENLNLTPAQLNCFTSLIEA